MVWGHFCSAVGWYAGCCVTKGCGPTEPVRTPPPIKSRGGEEEAFLCFVVPSPGPGLMVWLLIPRPPASSPFAALPMLLRPRPFFLGNLWRFFFFFSNYWTDYYLRNSSIDPRFAVVSCAIQIFPVNRIYCLPGIIYVISSGHIMFYRVHINASSARYMIGKILNLANQISCR